MGRISRLDASTHAKVMAACNFINAEISRLRHRSTTAGIIIAALAFTVWLVFRVQNLALLAGVSFAMLVLVVGYFENQLRKVYKQIVVRRLVSALGGGLSYNPESEFSKEEFLQLDLFSRNIDNFRSEDEVRGSRPPVNYTIREAFATRTEGSGKHRRTVTVFKGLLVSLDFNKHFSGHTVVVRNQDSAILGELFGEWESRGNKTLTHMESVEFEEQFSVYTTDAQQARYILTPKLMELILRAQEGFDGPMRMSFQDSSVVLAIPQSVNRFEISLFRMSPVTPESAVSELAEVVQMAESMIEVLDLETRIWSRV
jgi:hypothetical protein